MTHIVLFIVCTIVKTSSLWSCIVCFLSFTIVYAIRTFVITTTVLMRYIDFLARRREIITSSLRSVIVCFGFYWKHSNKEWNKNKEKRYKFHRNYLLHWLYIFNCLPYSLHHSLNEFEFPLQLVAHFDSAHLNHS